MVGNRLMDFRKEYGLTKEQMGKMLLISGEKYGALESNKDIPNDLETAQMASLLGVSKEYLQMGGCEIAKLKGKTGKYLIHTPDGFACTEKFCGWRQNCGGGKLYCPGAGCMKEWEERHGTKRA